MENTTQWTCTGILKVFKKKSHTAFSDTYSLNSYHNAVTTKRPIEVTFTKFFFNDNRDNRDNFCVFVSRRSLLSLLALLSFNAQQQS